MSQNLVNLELRSATAKVLFFGRFLGEIFQNPNRCHINQAVHQIEIHEFETDIIINSNLVVF